MKIICDEKTLEILCFVICVEDYHKLTQTQFLIESPLGNLTSVLKKPPYNGNAVEDASGTTKYS